MITVAVHPGFEHAPRPTDLYVNRYLADAPVDSLRVIHLDSGGSFHKSWPPNASTLLQDFWAIFIGPDPVRFGQRYHQFVEA